MWQQKEFRPRWIEICMEATSVRALFKTEIYERSSPSYTILPCSVSSQLTRGSWKSSISALQNIQLLKIKDRGNKNKTWTQFAKNFTLHRSPQWSFADIYGHMWSCMKCAIPGVDHSLWWHSLQKYSQFSLIMFNIHY